jgi:exopolysaccharide biosynthesis polyprenyl glycosylphosphotransferase
MRFERNLVVEELELTEQERARPAGVLSHKIARSGVLATSWGRRDRVVRRVLVLADLAAICLALAAAMVLAGQRDEPLAPLVPLLLSLPVWILLFKLYGLYDRDIKRISHNTIDDVPWLFHALLIGTLGFWGLLRWYPIDQMTLYEGFLFGLIAFALVLALRAGSRRIIVAVTAPERILLAGAEPVVATLVRKISSHPEYGLLPVGIVEPREHLAQAEQVLSPLELPLLGDPAELERVVLAHRAERVLICRSEFNSDQVLAMIDLCRRYSLKVSILPDALESLGPSVEVDEVEGITLLGINPPVLGRTSRMIKRAFDLLISAVVLVLAAPLMALTAVAIKLDSKGAVFFRQSRVGAGGHRFRIVKFRTMVADAEAQRQSLMAASPDQRWLHLEDDPRVTRVGRFLRRTSLDELPQFFNVIRGEMSLVGPRPLPEAEDASVGGWARGRLDLTPGITGTWQVLGRTTIPFDEMVKLDYMYVTNWSLWMDIRLLLRTFPVVLGRRGAN